MRSTRNLMRQRMRYVQTRGTETGFLDIFCVQHGVPTLTKLLKKKTTRHELIEQFANKDQRLTVYAKLEHIRFLDGIIHDLEKQVYNQAQSHDPQSLALLLAIPGIGPILALTLLYEIHAIDRFKTHQRFSSYCRVVKCEKESNGKITGSRGQKIGNPYLRWALGEVVVHSCQKSPKIQKTKQRLEAKHGKAKSLSILAH